MSYTIHGHILEHTSSAKYLGVIFDPLLTWDTHISNLTKKTSGVNAFIQCLCHIKAKCYLALVRPLHEYSTVVWDHHAEESTENIEKVQRRFARYCLHDYAR